VIIGGSTVLAEAMVTLGFEVLTASESDLLDGSSQSCSQAEQPTSRVCRGPGSEQARKCLPGANS